MSKIMLIGDTHLCLGFPNSVDKWLKVHKEYFNDFLIPLIKRELTKDDIIIHLGDLFDNRDLVPINILNYAQSILEEISSICPVHILVGNHDLYTKASNDINTIKVFKYMPNVKIYESPEVIEFCGKRILMMPWVEQKKNQVEILKKFSGCDYLFCHSDLNGAKMHLTSVAHRNNDKIDVGDFTGYKRVYSGHIHLTQRNKNFTFVGNLFDMDRNDYMNEKGIFVLDAINDKETFFINNVSPKFQKLHILNESDISKLEGVNTKDYIDLFISNSLLIGNRKLRRKLEIILETGSFANVEYIDDLVKVEAKAEKISVEDMLSEDFIPKLDMDYTDIIRNYIDSQTYTSEKIKLGVKSEYEDIVRIYSNS